MSMIDLRSDTVTYPTPAMREAMFHAEVGDDVFGDDPTVNRLERLAAERVGKEAALFVPSGTQGNQIAVMTHTRRGDAILIGRGYHIADHEAGAYALLSGVSPRYVRDSGGALDPRAVREAITDDSDLQVARAGLVCLENALSNGMVAPLENMREIHAIARGRGVPVHLDGARLFNAALRLGVDARELAACCDSVMFCLSKGLCAPAGSILAGSRDFIAKARKNRKLLGGGMRQAGFLAAAGILAITEMPERLAEDHDNARYLAKRLSELPGVRADPGRVQINMVFFTIDREPGFLAALPGKLLERGILSLGPSDGEFRMVTHRSVTRGDCDTVASALGAILREGAV